MNYGQITLTASNFFRNRLSMSKIAFERICSLEKYDFSIVSLYLGIFLKCQVIVMVTCIYLLCAYETLELSSSKDCLETWLSVCI